MVLSKLYVVGSVLISNLKITKCKNSKRKRMTGSFRRKKASFVHFGFTFSLHTPHFSFSLPMVKGKDA